MSGKPHFVVTGGAGFIGSNLVKELMRRYPSHGVAVIDDMSHADPANLDGLDVRIIDEPVNFVQPLDQLPVYDKIVGIFHMAAISNTAADGGVEMQNVNVKATQELAIAAQSMCVPFVYASSAGVYGNGPTPMKEDQQLLPLSDYATSKVQCDLIMEIFHPGNLLYNDENAAIVGLRYFNVYGPGEAHKIHSNSCSPVLHFFRQIRDGGVVRVFIGSENFKRDFIHVDDAVEATIRAYESGVTGIFNVGTGHSSSFLDVLEEVQRATGRKIRIEWMEMPADMARRYQHDTRADMTRSRQRLGFEPRICLREGVHSYVKELQEETDGS